MSTETRLLISTALAQISRTKATNLESQAKINRTRLLTNQSAVRCEKHCIRYRLSNSIRSKIARNPLKATGRKGLNKRVALQFWLSQI
jgi:hypothetical protein